MSSVDSIDISNIEGISALMSESELLEQQLLEEDVPPTRASNDNPSQPRVRNVELDVAKSKYPQIAKFLLDRTKQILDAEKLSEFTVKLVEGYSTNNTRIEEGQRKFIQYGEALLDEVMSGKKYFKIFYAFNIEGTNLKHYTVIVDDGERTKLTNSVKITSTMLEEITYALCKDGNDFSSLFPSVWDKYYKTTLSEVNKLLGE